MQLVNIKKTPYQRLFCARPLKTKYVIQSLIDSDPDILKAPAALIAVGELTDNSVNIFVRPWVTTNKVLDVRFRFTELVQKKFDVI